MSETKRSGPPTASEINAMLAAVTDVRSLTSNTVMTVLGELYGASDWEGANGMDVRMALGYRVPPRDDDRMLSTAQRLVEYNLNGLGWAWTLHSQTRPEHGYVAHLRKGLEVSTIPQKHRYASYALIMALMLAVEIEREIQRGKVKSQTR